MEGTTAGTETASFRAERLQQILKSAVGYFRVGEDTEGMDSFRDAMKELELVVEGDRNLQQPQIDLNRLLPALRTLYFYMRNQDITGMTDCLENMVVPLADERQKGCDEI